MNQQHRFDVNDTRLLVITGDPEDVSLIRDSTSARHWSMTHTASVTQGVRLLEQEEFEIVLCDHQLADGDWSRVLAATEAMPKPPLVIVTSSRADDRLWSDVLNLGGYDVLMKPLERSEIIYVLNTAWSCNRQRSVTALAQAVTPPVRCLAQ